MKTLKRAGVFAAGFVVGSYIQMRFDKWTLKKILMEKVRNKELDVLGSDLRNYIHEAVNDDSVSVEEYDQTIREKFAFYNIVKEI